MQASRVVNDAGVMLDHRPEHLQEMAIPSPFGECIPQAYMAGRICGLGAQHT